MAHIEDRWYTAHRAEDGSPVLNSKGKPVMVRSGRYGRGMRYRARYEAPDGRERSQSFANGEKKAAEDFLLTVGSDMLRGTYVDPAAGQMSFADFAESWLRTHACDESTRESMEIRVRKHIIPFFRKDTLGSIKPSQIREWDHSLKDELGLSTRSVAFAYLRAIFSAAVDDERILKNPCSAKSVQQPRPVEREVIPWELDQVQAVQAGLLPRYRSMVDIGAGCGLRQGEVFGLSRDDIDFETGWLRVRRQVKIVRSRLVFGLPKNDKERRVPLPETVALSLRRHMLAVHPTEVTLPWESPSGDPVTVRLLFTSGRDNALNRSTFATKSWHPALTAAALPLIRSNGFHALRHFYASALLDAGESIKALAVYLGHHDAAYTLRVYTHLQKTSEERTRKAIDALFRGPAATDGPATAQDVA